MSDWNPEKYLAFRSERTQPSIDLVARIDIQEPRAIVDIGCGPGNSTQVLRQRWPAVRVCGLDNSPEMIRKAREDFPDGEWVLGDAAAYQPDHTFDIVFSNATLQWIPNHGRLIPRLFSFVHARGALAVQVPANQDSPLHQALVTVASSATWTHYTRECLDLFTYRPAAYYYDLLVGQAPRIDLWETTYQHVLASHQALLDWYKGTGMRPFLERLPDDNSRREFEADVLDICRQHYETRTDGKVLYPFRRLFFVAYRA